MARRRGLVDDEDVDELVGEEGGEPILTASGGNRTLVDALDRNSGLDSDAARVVVVVVSVLER